MLESPHSTFGYRDDWDPLETMDGFDAEGTSHAPLAVDIIAAAIVPEQEALELLLGRLDDLHYFATHLAQRL